MTILPTEIEFDSLELRTVPVRLAGRDYRLKEMSGPLGTEYLSKAMKYATVGDDGKVVMSDNVNEVGVILVAYSLWDTETDERVPLETIHSWPHRIVQQLIKEARNINGIGKDQSTGKS